MSASLDRARKHSPRRNIQKGASPFGSGTTVLEGRFAELICDVVPFVERVQILNTGSEATCQAIRAARAITGRDHVIVMQGGYATIAGVEPDQVVYGKAAANGHPLAVLGGKKEMMDVFAHPDPGRRILLAGTYNGHPVPTVAAIATLERLRDNDGEVYRHIEALGQRLEDGVKKMLVELGIQAAIVRH